MTQKRDYVVVVTGLPRSGTSMAMRMLEAGGISPLIDEIREADTDNPRGYYEFEPVKKTKTDPSWLNSAPGMAVKLVYRLLYDLPDTFQYRALFMNRHLPEVMASQDAMLARTGADVPPMDEKKFVELFGGECQRVKKWLAAQPNFSVLDVQYNEMVESPQSQVATIDEFLDGGLDTEAMCRVVEPTLYRQRR